MPAISWSLKAICSSFTISTQVVFRSESKESKVGCEKVSGYMFLATRFEVVRKSSGIELWPNENDSLFSKIALFPVSAPTG